jgi:hypothetical protein
VSEFEGISARLPKTPLDIMLDISHKNFAGWLPIFAAEEGCGHTIYWDSACRSIQPYFFLFLTLESKFLSIQFNLIA